MKNRHRPHRRSILRHKDMLHGTKEVRTVEIRRSCIRYSDAKKYIGHIVQSLYFYNGVKNAFSNDQKGLEKYSKKEVHSPVTRDH